MLDNYSDVAPPIIATGTILALKNAPSKWAKTMKQLISFMVKPRLALTASCLWVSLRLPKQPFIESLTMLQSTQIHELANISQCCCIK